MDQECREWVGPASGEPVCVDQVTLERGTLVDHARRELQLCGQWNEDPGYSAALVAAVAAYASYGHSGGSTSMAIRQLGILLRRGTLSELTGDPAEWIDLREQSGCPMWQSVRCPAAFSDDGGRTFWLLPNRDGVTGWPNIPPGTASEVRAGRRFYRSAQRS